MNREVFALIDCNNFFVSCERLFRPDLEGKPVVVLSSNDGCAVARSNEAKALGIPMAAPAFKYRALFERHKVVQFSANFDLYGDISRRITELLTSITPRIEVYSVDESFLDLSELGIDDYENWGRTVRQQILNWIGIPVSIGIAPTKTLAKLAAARAKKIPKLEGVLSLYATGSIPGVYSESPGSASATGASAVSPVERPREAEYTPGIEEKYLRLTPLEDVWGIGRRLAPRLQALGLHSAFDLSRLSPGLARQLVGSKHGAQLVSELNGTSCYPLVKEGTMQKSIARTRTFGEDTNDPGVLEAAIANFTAKAAFRLRQEGLLARRASLFITTNKHKPGYKAWSIDTKLPMPTADTGFLTDTLVTCLHQVMTSGALYHRAGVLLYDFIPAQALQTDFFGIVSPLVHDRSTRRMQALDGLNLRYGKDTLHFAVQDLGTAWQPKHQMRSPRYTTRWDELQTVQILNGGVI